MEVPEQLADRLCELVAELPCAKGWLVTMTGEMADCFEDRVTGVRFIVQQTQQAARRANVSLIKYYATETDSGADGGFVDAACAIQSPYRVASANWHAMARYVAKESMSLSNAIMVDVGSTTTDLIPLAAVKC